MACGVLFLALRVVFALAEVFTFINDSCSCLEAIGTTPSDVTQFMRPFVTF